jgi:hypothetical protein
METGKFVLSFPHTLSLNPVVPTPSLMETQIAQDAQQLNAVRNAPKVFLIVRLQEMMCVDILVWKTEVGKKESILECTETSRSSRRLGNSWDWIRISAQVRLDCQVTVTEDD